MSPGSDSTHSYLRLYTETTIPHLDFSSKTVQLSAGRILNVCLSTYLDFKYYQLLGSLPSLCLLYTQIIFLIRKSLSRIIIS